MYEFSLFTDYFQFSLEDEQSYSAERSFVFTDQDLANRVWVDPGMIIVFTARNMDAPVVVEVVESAPDDDVTSWDHIVEASIDVPSGRIVIAGNEYYPDSARVSVQSGTYRVRMYHANLGSISNDGLAGDDHYKLVLWPGSSIQPQVLKRWNPTEQST